MLLQHIALPKSSAAINFSCLAIKMFLQTFLFLTSLAFRMVAEAISEDVKLSPLEGLPLSNREISVIKEAARCKYLQEAAHSLSRSPRTIERHFYRAHKKRGVKATFSLAIIELSQGKLPLEDLLSQETLSRFEEGFYRVTLAEKSVANELYRSALEKKSVRHSDVAKRLFISRKTIDVHVYNFYRKIGLEHPNPVLSAAAFYAYVKWDEEFASGNASELPFPQPEPVQLGNGACLTARQLQALKQAASLNYDINFPYKSAYWLMNAFGISDGRAKAVLALSKGYLSLDELVNGKAKVLESELVALPPAWKETLLALYRCALEKGTTSNADIASFLDISAFTLKFRLEHYRSKLPVISNPLQLSVAAYYLAQKMA